MQYMKPGARGLNMKKKNQSDLDKKIKELVTVIACQKKNRMRYFILVSYTISHDDNKKSSKMWPLLK